MFARGCCGSCGGDLPGAGGLLAGPVAAAAVVAGHSIDEAEPVPFVDGGPDDAEAGGELPAGEEFLVRAGGWPSGGGDLLAGGARLAGPVERVAAVVGAGRVDEAEA